MVELLFGRRDRQYTEDQGHDSSVSLSWLDSMGRSSDHRIAPRVNEHFLVPFLCWSCSIYTRSARYECDHLGPCCHDCHYIHDLRIFWSHPTLATAMPIQDFSDKSLQWDVQSGELLIHEVRFFHSQSSENSHSPLETENYFRDEELERLVVVEGRGAFQSESGLEIL